MFSTRSEGPTRLEGYFLMCKEERNGQHNANTGYSQGQTLPPPLPPSHPTLSAHTEPPIAQRHSGNDITS